MTDETLPLNTMIHTFERARHFYRRDTCIARAIYHAFIWRSRATRVFFHFHQILARIRPCLTVSAPVPPSCHAFTFEQQNIYVIATLARFPANAAPLLYRLHCASDFGDKAGTAHGSEISRPHKF